MKKLFFLLSLLFMASLSYAQSVDAKVDSLQINTADPYYNSQNLSLTVHYSWNSADNLSFSYYLSEDSVFSASDILIETVSVNGQGDISNTQQVFLPVTGSGDKYLLVVANAQLTIYESDFGNNQAHKAISISEQPTPDLRVRSLEPPITTYEAGATMTGIRLVIEKEGNLSTSLGTKLYASKDAVLDTDDQAIFEETRFPGSFNFVGDSMALTISANLPVATDTAIHYLIAHIDTRHSTFESDEANNILAKEITVNPIARPDLLVNEIIAADVVKISAPFDVSVRLLNQGQAISPTSDAALYLSEDETLSSDDYKFATNYGPLSLAINESASLVNSYVIPSFIDPGNYFLIAAADADQYDREQDETNNVFTRAIQVDPADIADFAFNDFAPVRTGIDAGSLVDVDFTIRNQGSQTAAFNSVSVYLSTDSILDDSDMYIKSLSTNQTVAAGGSFSSQNGVYDLRFPASLRAGAYMLWALANEERLTKESDYNNNDTLYTISIRNADAVAESGSINKAFLGAGESFQLSYSLKNIDTVAALPSIGVQYYFSADSAFSEEDVWLGEEIRVGLAPTATSSVSRQLVTPSSVGSGKKYIVVVLDEDELVAENNEDNNLLFVPIELKAPDLQIQDFALNPVVVDAAGSANLEFKLENAGEVASGAFSVDFYLSEDEEVDETDLYLWNEFSSGLNADTLTNTIIRQIAVPALPAGSYTVLAVVDADSVVQESNEANNSASTEMVIENADLIFVNVALVKETIEIGQADTINFNIRNQGQAVARNFSYSLSLVNEAGDFAYTIGERSIASLGGDGEATSRLEWIFNVPSNFPGTQAIVQLKVDSDSVVVELDETNNIALDTITLILPDLLIKNELVSPTTVDVGFSTTVSYTVENIGDSKASAGFVDFFVSDNTTYEEENDTYIGSISLPSLDKAKSENFSFNLDFPSNLSPGSLNLIYYVDGDEAISEKNESNNIVSEAITIRVGDLVVSSATTDKDTVAVTDTFRLTAKVKNESTSATVPPSSLYVYLSEDPVLGGDDLFGFTLNVSQLTSTQTSADLIADVNLANLGLGNLSPGSYYVLFEADGPKSITETNENNNVRPMEIIIQGPDVLPINLLTNKQRYDQGETGTLEFNIRNSGLVNAPAHFYSIYLSDTDTLTETSILMAEGFVNTINAQQNSTTISENIGYATSIGPGDYFLFVVADSYEYIGEINEENNIASTAISIKAADLRSENLRLSEDTLNLDQNTVLSFDISNLGEGRASTSTTGIRIRSVSSDSSYFVGAVNTPAIAASAKVSDLSFNWTVSLQDADTGYNYLYVVADRFNTLKESNETNNIDSILLYINPTDVKMDTAIVSPSQLEEFYTPTQADFVYINSLVRYTFLQSTEIRPAVYISTNTTLDSQDSLLQVEYLGTSQANGLEQSNLGIYVPRRLTEGTYYLIFEVDPVNLLKEKDEENNRMAIALQVGEPLLPDLRVRAAETDPGLIASGRKVTVHTLIDNNGAAESPNHKVYYFLSTDENLDDGDTSLGENLRHQLYPTEKDNLIDTLLIPESTAAGEYFILAKADAEELIEEQSEGNNVFAQSITVRDPYEVDMAITFASQLYESVLPGDYNLASFEVENLGLALAEQEQVLRVYLSTDEAVSDEDEEIYRLEIEQSGPYSLLEAYAWFQVPANTSPGDYFFLIHIDDTDVYDEPDEENNLRVLPIKVLAPLAPDMEWIQLSTGTLNPNTSFNVQAQVRNIGGGITDDININLYLSANSVLSEEDLLVGSIGTDWDLARFEETVIDSVLFLPPTITEGRYFLFAQIDENQSLGESDYSNNLFVKEVQIGTPQIPDFELYNINDVITYTNEIGAERTQVFVRNNGNLGETATISVYLSTNYQLDSSDPLLANGDIFLQAGFNAPVNVNLTVPTSTAVGEYFLIAVVNENEAIYEEDFSNNTVVGSFTMNSASQADFALSNLSLTKASINANTLVDVGYRIDNTDRLTVDEVDVSFYLSTDAVFTSSDRLIDTQVVEQLRGFSAMNLSYPLLIPEDVAEGDYYLFVVADPNNQFTENDEDNNLLAAQVEILEAVRPDFSLQVNSASSSQAANTAFTLDYSLFNFTLAGANNVEVDIYLSSDAEVDESDVLLSQDLIPIVRENSSNRRFVEIYIPGEQATGSYQLLLVADPEDNIVETNESNNFLSRSLTITQAVLPDLAINQINSASSVQAGDSLYIQLQVANLAAGYAAASTIKVLLQNNEMNYDLATISLAEVPGLVSGTLDSLLSIPLEVAAGTYDILVEIDFDNEVEESNEDNNTLTRTLMVISAPAHDLSIDNASLSRNDLSTSTSASLTVNVSNAGANLAPETQVTVFLSEDGNLDASDLAVLSLSVPRLEASQSRSLNGTVAIPESYQALGAHSLILVLDADALSNDANRDNNVSSLSITIEEPLGITTLRDELSVYPNPVNDRLMIDSKMPLRLVQVIDASGRKILEEERASTQIQVATHSWKPGVYLVLLTDESGQTARVRIVKQ
ncbi:CARDB domain-containing protein [Cytophagales bacterium LB-30]|uniref:CARDB domain-containing protein n=1 Tax=Shiella aurantiaca TaxID=3058365 RepID=A0ABT8F5D1_9BACT|nr:CARDB domain-containing protein [Shiella aurantiaca]MDN4165647.1 CARDB domain-containing protein [Shiella aurantiaca]